MATETGTGNLLKRILEYIKTRDFQALSAAELAPDVIAMADNLGEVDVYFDESKWHFTYPEIWIRPKGDHSPGSCTQPFEGVGLLQGVGSVPQIRSLHSALPFAMRNLTSSQPVTWNKTPKSLPI